MAPTGDFRHVIMYAGANRKSSLQKLTGEPIIASCHKTSASQGRGFCELSFISSFFQALCSSTLLAITSASLSLAQPIATYGICYSRSHEIRAAAAYAAVPDILLWPCVRCLVGVATQLSTTRGVRMELSGSFWRSGWQTSPVGFDWGRGRPGDSSSL